MQILEVTKQRHVIRDYRVTKVTYSPRPLLALVFPVPNLTLSPNASE